MTGDERTVLVDASVFITLAEVGLLDQLRSLSGDVVLPTAVQREITDDPAETALERAMTVEARWIRVDDSPDETTLERAAAHLDRQSTESGPSGDVALLAHAMVVAEPVVVTDDKPLRKGCRALSVPVSGSIGVLVRAVERGDIDADEAKENLYAMDEVGARLSASLVRRAERLIDDAREN